uniref:hypothetical protein n=1 Tax=Dialister sp. TaxID=1955814 RepID=UPI004024A886
MKCDRRPPARLHRVCRIPFENAPRAACYLNVLCAGKEIRAAFSAEEDPLLREEQVACAVYDIETGKVEWLDEDD